MARQTAAVSSGAFLSFPSLASTLLASFGALNKLSRTCLDVYFLLLLLMYVRCPLSVMESLVTLSCHPLWASLTQVCGAKSQFEVIIESAYNRNDLIVTCHGYLQPISAGHRRYARSDNRPLDSTRSQHLTELVLHYWRSESVSIRCYVSA